MVEERTQWASRNPAVQAAQVCCCVTFPSRNCVTRAHVCRCNRACGPHSLVRSMRHRKWSHTTRFPASEQPLPTIPVCSSGVGGWAGSRSRSCTDPTRSLAATGRRDRLGRPVATGRRRRTCRASRGPNPRRFDNNSTRAPLSPSVEPDSLVRSMRHRKWSQTTRFPASKQTLLTTS